MRQFGLIGYPLSHSFSKKYFTEKFVKEGITGCSYELYEIDGIQKVEKEVFGVEGLVGFNVTIPYKQEIKQYLHEFDHSAIKVGAVNVVKIEGTKRIGFNSDYYGFKHSLERWMPNAKSEGALVLGTGGAAKAVFAVLTDLGIDFKVVSRSMGEGVITYDDIQQQPEILTDSKLVINTTPLGMSPKVGVAPALPYDAITSEHYFFDLVYNPEETQFMKEALSRKAHAKNGYEMLVLQAERSWEIWNG